MLLFDLLLKDQHRRFHSCCTTSLEVVKAFDSVSHQAIFFLLDAYGFPRDFIAYTEDLYNNSNTYWDPLLPILFNIDIDGLLRILPNHISARTDETPINAPAFADDLVRAAPTEKGRQEL